MAVVIPITSRIATVPVGPAAARPALSLVPPPRPSQATYLRRRAVALVLLVGVALLPVGVVQTVFADRGGDPATTSAAGGHAPVAPMGGAHVVQAGDTLWSLGERFHGATPLADYVEQLVALNGGTALAPGQLLILPGG